MPRRRSRSPVRATHGTHAPAPVRAVRLALRRAVHVALPVVFLLVACGDDADPVGPPNPTGTVSFQYTGAETGSFHASGAVVRNAAGHPRFGTFAAGYHSRDTVAITGFQALSDPRGHALALGILRLATAGSVTLDPTQCAPPAPCALGAIVLDTEVRAFQALLGAPGRLYTFRSGAIVVTSLSADRLRGTFQGEAVALENPAQVIQVANGSFDVPLID
jgi:hypothetical protein